MRKYFLAVLVLALIAMGLDATGILSLPPVLPQALFGIAMILVLLTLIDDSDRKRL